MAKRFRLPRQSAVTLNQYTGEAGEVRYDKDNKKPRTFDGVTLGGTLLATGGDVDVVASRVTKLENASLQQMMATLRTATQAQCFDANRRPASGTLPFEWIVPGGDYGAGQWVWDYAWTAEVAAFLGTDQAKQAQLQMRNFIPRQAANGFIPCTISPNQASDNTNYSQTPLLARAAYKLYLKTGDVGFLNTVYDMLKKYYAWWENFRSDGVLFTWGSSRVGSPGAGQVAQDARYESGQDAITGFFDGAYCAISGMTVDHATPDCNGFMADFAENMVKIATAIGNGGDAATYQTKYNNLCAAMRNYMWDEEYGRFCSVLRSDLAFAVGSLAGGSAAGTKSVTLNAAIGRAVAKGAKLDFGNGVVAQVNADLVGTETVIPLMVGLTAGVAANTNVALRTLQYYHTALNHSIPMMAGVPTQAQARRMVDENLLYAFDGSVQDTHYTYYGSDYLKNGDARGFFMKFKHLAWGPPTNDSGATINKNNWEHAFGNGAPIATSYARALQDTNAQQVSSYFPEWDYSARYRPLSASYSYYKAAGSSGIQVLMSNWPANSFVYNTQLPLPAGNEGDIVTSNIDPVTITERPYYMRVLQIANGGNTANLKLTRQALTFQPRGYCFLTPSGLLADHRLSTISVALETNSSTSNAVESRDYWHGDQWVNLEYAAVVGFMRYGMSQYAEMLGRRVIDRVYRERVRTGEMWERYSMRGQGKGSNNYAWTGLVMNIANILGLAQPGA